MPDEVVAGALETVPQEFLAALEQARDQIRDFHEREREQSWFTARADGTLLGVKVTPVASAAVYVPGGRARSTPPPSSWTPSPPRSRACSAWSW